MLYLQDCLLTNGKGLFLVNMIMNLQTFPHISRLGKVLQAELVLKKIRGGADVKRELAGIINSCQKDSEKGKDHIISCN